jgi:hypothetical protein
MSRRVRRRQHRLRRGAKAPLQAWLAARLAGPLRFPHPWEDFAETWAHYLHFVDTLEMVAASGMSVRPPVDEEGDHSASVKFDSYFASSLDLILKSWLPFVFSINSVSRAMGEGDLYPFVIAPPVIKKLGFVHDLIHGQV